MESFTRFGLDESFFETPSTIPADAFENLPVPPTPWESFTSGVGGFFDSLFAGSQGHRGMSKLPEEASAPAGGGGGFWDSLSEGSKHGPR